VPVNTGNETEIPPSSLFADPVLVTLSWILASCPIVIEEGTLIELKYGCGDCDNAGVATIATDTASMVGKTKCFMSALLSWNEVFELGHYG